MGWFSPKNVYPFPVAELEPDGNIGTKVSMWPRPNTIRIDGRRRWASDAHIAPLASRIWGRVNYNDLGFPQLAEEPNFEYFWTDLHFVEPGHLRGILGRSNSGTTYRHDVQFFETMPFLGVRGVRVDQTIGIHGDPVASRQTEYPDMEYNKAYSVVPGPPGPRNPADETPYPGTWPFKQVLWWPMSECFPTHLLPNEVDMSNELAGVVVNATTGQSVNGGVLVDFNAPVFEQGGQWWNPLGNANEIVVPEPWNYVRFNCGYLGGEAIKKLASIFVYINGNADYPGPVGMQERRPDIAQTPNLFACGQRWIPVSPGDIIQLRIRCDGGTLSSTLGRTYLAVSGGFFI